MRSSTAWCNGCAPRAPFAPECFDTVPDPVLEASRFREAEPATAAVGQGPKHLGVHCMALFGKDRERNDRPRTPAPTAGVPKAVVYGLAGYAVLMTALAVYGLFFKVGSLPPEHPLSTIPDTFGEHAPASRKKVSQYHFKTDGELPANLRAELGREGQAFRGGREPVTPVTLRHEAGTVGGQQHLGRRRTVGREGGHPDRRCTQ